MKPVLLLTSLLLLLACAGPSYQLKVSPQNHSTVQKVYSGRELAATQINDVITWVGGYVEQGELYLWVAQRNLSQGYTHLNPSEITIRYQCSSGDQKYYRAIDPNDLIAAKRREAANSAALQSVLVGLNANNAATRTSSGCAYGVGQAYGTGGYAVAEGAACGYSQEVDPVARQYYLNSQSQQIQNQHSASLSYVDQLAQILLWPITLEPQKEVGGWVNFGKPPSTSCAIGYIVEVPAGNGRASVRLDPFK